MRLTRQLLQMRLLRDDNFPADFATSLAEHDTSNVHSHGWAGIKKRDRSAVCTHYW